MLWRRLHAYSSKFQFLISNIQVAHTTSAKNQIISETFETLANHISQRTNIIIKFKAANCSELIQLSKHIDETAYH